MHENPSVPTTLQRDLMKLGSWKELLFEVFFFFFLLISLWLDFVFVIATLEIFLSNYTWNKILVPNLVLLSSKLRLTKPWFHNEDLTYEEMPIQIVDVMDKVLRHVVVKLVKVQWSNYSIQEATWELKK